MALSNWDLLALDEGGVCGGGLETPTGLSAMIYKDSFRVSEASDPDAAVLILSEGDAQFRDLMIKAVRGPQYGIYVMAWTGSRWLPEKPFKAMAGCGVYGWADDRHSDTDHECALILDSGPKRWRCGATYTPAKYEGVLPDSLSFLRAHVAGHLDELPDDHPLRQGETWAGAQRFNQGDTYIASQLFQHESLTGLTEPGRASLPIMSGQLEKLHDV